MKNSHTSSRAKNRQAGYALLLVMFFVALLVLAVAAAAPSVLTQVRREKEQQMIWRGKQYALGVQRYYTKLHRFPTSLDDLYKPKTGIRFMRQAYKDPTNKEDGAWRLIYVGPNGQLIGSLKAQPPNLGGMERKGNRHLVELVATLRRHPVTACFPVRERASVLQLRAPLRQPMQAPVLRRTRDRLTPTPAISLAETSSELAAK